MNFTVVEMPTSAPTGSTEALCLQSCLETVNNSGTCNNTCPAYNMKQVKYGHCDQCLTMYDGGTTYSMSSGKCINTVCKYINYLSPFTVCEDTSDPPPSYRCPFWYEYNSTSYNCTSECADGYLSFNRLC